MLARSAARGSGRLQGLSLCQWQKGLPLRRNQERTQTEEYLQDATNSLQIQGIKESHRTCVARISTINEMQCLPYDLGHLQ